MPRTSCPRSRKRSARWLPRKPAMPVTKTLMVPGGSHVAPPPPANAGRSGKSRLAGLNSSKFGKGCALRRQHPAAG